MFNKGKSRRMQKFIVFVLTVATSATLLIIQFILLRSFAHVDDNSFHFEERGTWKLLQTVSEEAEAQGIHLFIADNVILKELKNDRKDDSACHILCHGRRITYLGSLGHLSTRSQKDKFFSSLTTRGLQHFTASGYDPNLKRHGLQVQISYAAFVSAYGYVVVIHFLYERPGKFWWQGVINETVRQSESFRKVIGNISDLVIASYENAYDPFEIYPAMVDDIKLFIPLSLNNVVRPKASTRFVECNHTRSKLFYEKHRPDDSPEATEFRKKAWRLLSKAKNLLDELRIPFWLSSGTCLGYYRQCDFITYGKDVDIGIWIKDFDPRIVHIFSTNGLPLTHWFGRTQDSLELSFRDDNVKLDVFFFYQERDHVWNGGTQARTGRKFKYVFPRFALCWTEFLELKLRVPCKTEEYIRANYGKNWMEPLQVWDWKKSPPNVGENGQWPVEEWSEVIRLMSLPET